MDAQSEQIIKHIQEKREQLGDNLAELETRVRAETNWRTHFQRKPWLMMALALGGGLLAASLLTPVRRNRS